MGSAVEILKSAWEFLKGEGNASAVIALCALFFTAYQTFAKRKYDRLTVRPYVRTFEEKELNNQGGKIIVSLQNHGLGPALIKRYRVLLHGVPVDASSELSVAEAREKVLNNDANAIRFYVANLASGYMIKREESLECIVVEFSAPSLEKVVQVYTRAKGFEMEVTYESLYCDEFVFDSARSER